MEIIVNKVRDNSLLVIDRYYNVNDILLFDIETTGFAAEATELYLIGCAYYENDSFTIKQWFNDDGNSETEILKDFFEFASKYKYLLHYNGDGFDIPYITKKSHKHNIENLYPSDIESIDLYKLIRQLKEPLKLDNLKQKSIEKFLGINRLDKYTGGDLIQIYKDFLKTNSSVNKQLVLQHNYEDLEGLLYCFSTLSYIKFKSGCFVVSKMSVRNERLLFSLQLTYDVPVRISLGANDIILTAYKNEATINVPIISEEMKFFFDNYKDYYYLPAEDMAVHKSVATYVDKNYRQQAKKENCYTKRKGYFITQIDNGIISGYKRNYNDRESFVELVDSFLQDVDTLNAYARHIVSKCF